MLAMLPTFAVVVIVYAALVFGTVLLLVWREGRAEHL
jgi:hypothetical protein